MIKNRYIDHIQIINTNHFDLIKSYKLKNDSLSMK